MYCKRCKNLLPENVYICNNCNFDNSLYYEYKNTLKSNKIKKKKQNSSFSVVALFILVCLGVVTFYSFNDNMTYGKVLSTPPKEVIVKKNNFVYQHFKFSYPENFGTSTNTIFFKNNTDINIKIKEITVDDYNTELNSHDFLDTYIKSIPAKTYAEDYKYGYLFIYNNKYYDISVNYINDGTYTELIQLTISNIINSLEIIA